MVEKLRRRQLNIYKLNKPDIIQEKESMENEQQFEYKIVGTDENGNPLYQRVPKAPETITGTTSVAGEVSSTPPSEPLPAQPPVRPRPKVPVAASDRLDNIVNGRPTTTRCNADFLYDGMDPKLVDKRHQQSVERFPSIQFLEKEFVLKVIRRHQIGVVGIWLGSALVLILLLFIWLQLSRSSGHNGFSYDDFLMSKDIMVLIFTVMGILALSFSLILTRVYNSNKMIVTTERVVQFISHSLFDMKKQTIDLNLIEDVSYHQNGFLPMIFGYGSVRLSTFGDESTYYFTFTPKPAEVSAKINDIVFAVKNEYPLAKMKSTPVDDDDEQLEQE